MLGGDTVSINIDVGDNSGLVLLPQANSRAYTNTGDIPARQDMIITLQKGSRFIFNADPLVLHAESKFIQNTELSVSENSGAIIIDWFSIGRSENGEKFLFSEYTSRLTISDSDSVFLIDQQHFTPDTIEYNTAGKFADYSQMLNIFFTGELQKYAELLDKSGCLTHSDSFIHSFIYNDNYTILRMLGRTRKHLQTVVCKLYLLLQQEPAIGFNALERKM